MDDTQAFWQIDMERQGWIIDSRLSQALLLVGKVQLEVESRRSMDNGYLIAGYDPEWQTSGDLSDLQMEKDLAYHIHERTVMKATALMTPS
jgi:hypothetical protein